MSISSQKCRQLLIFASNLLNFLANLIDVIVVVLMTLFGGNGLPRENHHPKSNKEALFDLRRQSLSLLDGTIRVIPRVITGYPTAVANLKKNEYKNVTWCYLSQSF